MVRSEALGGQLYFVAVLVAARPDVADGVPPLVGDARVRRYGNPTTVEIVKTRAEENRGDRLAPVLVQIFLSVCFCPVNDFQTSGRQDPGPGPGVRGAKADSGGLDPDGFSRSLNPDLNF